MFFCKYNDPIYVKLEKVSRLRETLRVLEYCTGRLT